MATTPSGMGGKEGQVLNLSWVCGRKEKTSGCILLKEDRYDDTTL